MVNIPLNNYVHQNEAAIADAVFTRAVAGLNRAPIRLQEVGRLLLAEGSLVLQPLAVSLDALDLLAVEVGDCDELDSGT